MSVLGSYKIRPAGRHILTVGRDLIRDSYAAVVELVKNAYDADSRDVHIEFRCKTDQTGYTVVIADHGHGMSRDTVIDKWMVPSTSDKLERRESPGGRVMQGRKGVGRYAASILGEDLLLETSTPSGEMTTLFVEWDVFETAKYLDDVEILIETTAVESQAGTRLTITGGREFLGEWNEEQFKKLRYELKKLMSPISRIGGSSSKEEFKIHLDIKGFPNIQDLNETIEPYPLFDLFDYRISGSIDAAGKGTLVYGQQKTRNSIEEKIPFDLGEKTGCGELFFDIRVYDREKEAIEELISRGLKDEAGNYAGKLQARQLLNQFNGIGVYRNGFRIRPLGDADFDWLKLNEQRVQNPSLRIGSNQAIGYVLIQSEELSGLVEKSARDGLRENAAYDRLKEIARKVLAELEKRRFEYRKMAGLSRPALKVERELERLFSFDLLEKNVRARLAKGGVNQKTTDEIIEIIAQDAAEKNIVVDGIRQMVAIYQGQATLGKIINIILHEGRRPLSFFRNQVSNLRFWYDSFLETKDPKKLEPFMKIVEGIGENAELLSKLFGRLDPLAAGKRAARKPQELKSTVQKALSVFEGEMKDKHVEAKVNGPDNFFLSLWPQDIYAIFTNLIDNSIYWMTEAKALKREITIDIVTSGEELSHIDYRDTGPGIEPNLIASEVIFEPQFTTKSSGTGLGLAIAGEAATRNNLELKAFETDSGTWFRIQPKTKGER